MDINPFALFLQYITVPSVILGALLITIYKVTGNRNKKGKNLDKTVPSTLGCIVFPILFINFIGFACLLFAYFSSV